jgi:hypothetical protein
LPTPQRKGAGGTPRGPPPHRRSNDGMGLKWGTNFSTPGHTCCKRASRGCAKAAIRPAVAGAWAGMRLETRRTPYSPCSPPRRSGPCRAIGGPIMVAYVRWTMTKPAKPQRDMRFSWAEWRAPERPKVDRAVLAFVEGHVFDATGLVSRTVGVCRLNPEMARTVVARVSIQKVYDPDGRSRRQAVIQGRDGGRRSSWESRRSLCLTFWMTAEAGGSRLTVPAILRHQARS